MKFADPPSEDSMTEQRQLNTNWLEAQYDILVIVYIGSRTLAILISPLSLLIAYILPESMRPVKKALQLAALALPAIAGASRLLLEINIRQRRPVRGNQYSVPPFDH